MNARWLRDLRLGAELTLTGGREARWRALLITLGVSFGVLLLLLAAATPHMLAAHEDRLAAQTGVSDGPASLAMLEISDTVGAQTVTVAALQPRSAHPPVPPGLRRVPALGTAVVSPALSGLLRTDPAVNRLLHARVVGTVGPSGLSDPRQLIAYVGADNLDGRPAVAQISGFGTATRDPLQGPIVVLLVILMVIALLLPIGVFIATASRFGSEPRDQRLAALRLLGADRAGVRRVAAGETLASALTGVVVALLLGELLRPLIARMNIVGLSVFAADVRPSGALTILIVVLVPAAAVIFTLAAMRRVVVDPLGVSRRWRAPRRRLSWRLLLPAVGFLLLVVMTFGHEWADSTRGQIQAAVGIVLVLVGVCALLPWLVEAVVARVDAGPVSWMLAVRRLRVDFGTSGRVVSAIGLAIAGAVALQCLFNSVQLHERHLDAGVGTGQAVIYGLAPTRETPLSVIARRLTDTSGVQQVAVLESVTTAHGGTAPASVSTCATIVAALRVNRCGRGSAFILAGSGLAAGHVLGDGRGRLVIPSDARTASLRAHPGASLDALSYDQLILTPEAAARLGCTPQFVDAAVQFDPGSSDAPAQLQNTVVGIDPLGQIIDNPGQAASIHVLIQLGHVVIGGAAAVLAVIGASLLLAGIEQLRERRRVLAALAAFGTPRPTLAASILWQVAIPIGLGLGLALALGIGLGAVLLRMVSIPPHFDWTAVAWLSLGGLVLTGAVTALTLPALWRHIDPTALYTE